MLANDRSCPFEASGKPSTWLPPGNSDASNKTGWEQQPPSETIEHATQSPGN